MIGHYRRCSSTVEHGFRKAGVVGSIPTIGFMNNTDTTADARRLLYDLYRQMPPADKARRLFEARRTGQVLSIAGIKNLNPAATKTQIWKTWAKRHLGEKLFNQVYGTHTNE